jgi:hypothetical protein
MRITMPLLTAALLAFVVGCTMNHPHAASRYGTFHDVIAKADRIVVRDGGFDCCGPVAEEGILCEITDPTEITRIRDAVIFADQEPGFCLCCGYPGIDWYQGTNLLALTGIQHGHAIRWKGFKGDAPLTTQSSKWLVDWLVQHGVNREMMPRRLYNAKIRREKAKGFLDDAGAEYQSFSALEDGTYSITLSRGATDLKSLKGLPVSALYLRMCTNVVDLSGIETLPVKTLHLEGQKIRNLEPLKKTKVQELFLRGTYIADFSPLRGLPLKKLTSNGGWFKDASVLEGMPLQELNISYTGITDLTPLRRCPLVHIECDQDDILNGWDVLRSINTLESINGVPVVEFWKKMDNTSANKEKQAESEN